MESTITAISNSLVWLYIQGGVRSVTNTCLLYLHAVSAINGLYVALVSPKLPGWSASGGDPCGEGWQGVTCTGSSITSMYASYSI